MERALILVGPSAVGKTTVMNGILAADARFAPIRSMTTRPMRTEGDTEYIHVDDAAFRRAIEEGALIEHMTYGAYSYGTPRIELERVAAMGGIPLLILDLQGVRSVKTGAYGGDARTVYLYDDLDTLEQRLYERELAHSPSAQALTTFMRRKNANIRDYLTLSEYAPYLDLFVRNEDVDTTVRTVLRAFDTGERTAEADARAVLADLARQAEQKENYRAGQ